MKVLGCVANNDPEINKLIILFLKNISASIWFLFSFKNRTKTRQIWLCDTKIKPTSYTWCSAF